MRDERILVVAGSVTSKMYEPIKMKLMSKGMKIRIVRFTLEEIDVIELSAWLSHQESHNTHESGDHDEIEKRVNRQLAEIFVDQHADRLDASRVVGVVMLQSEYDDFGPFDCALDPDVVEFWPTKPRSYTIIVGQDGDPYYV